MAVVSNITKSIIGISKVIERITTSLHTLFLFKSVNIYEEFKIMTNKKKVFRLIVGIIGAMLLCSCASTEQKRYSMLSRDIHVSTIALQEGRGDIASAYLLQAAKLVPEDTKKVNVKPFITTSKTGRTTQYVVMPKGSIEAPSIVLGSSTYNSILSQDPELNKQVISENKQITSDDKKATKLSIKIQKEDAKPKSGGLFGWIHDINLTFGLGIVGSIVALILCAIFLPEALPLVFNIIWSIWTCIFHVIVSIVSAIFKYIILWSQPLVSWLQNKLKPKT